MERYSEYKDSGVKWLGEIPSHWELLKSKYLWKETFENSTSGKEDLLSVSQYTGVTKSKADSRSESLIGYKIVHKDDLVINIMLAWLGGLGVSNDEGVVSPAYCIYKLIRDYNPKFLHYLYKTPMYLAEFARHSTGVVPSRWRMYTDDFGQVVSLLPPVEEQDAIVRYLDAATSKIDKAIAMQQKMIDLLNERKQIIIQNAVTKGLDDKVEMKDSGVEWIGMIPKHWEISKLKYLIDAPLKYGANEASDLIDYSCPRYIRITDIDTNGKLKEETYRSLPMNKAEPYLLKKGDLLFARSGATVGKAFLFEEDYAACYAGYLIKAHMDLQKVLPKFVYLYTQTFAYQRWKESIFIQATIQNISGERYANMQIPMPTLEEQNKIIDMLTPKMQRFDSAITNCQRQITLLQERKQIIINEVVTGKVKVS